MHHEREIIEDKLRETIVYRIDDGENEIFKKTLIISETEFVNLLAADDCKRSRKYKLLEIARKYL